MKEQKLVNEIKAYLKTLPNTFYFKCHGGIYGTAGLPDIVICYKGKFIGLECKAAGRQPTMLQKLTIKTIQNAGGVAQVIYSLDEVKELLEKII